MHSQIQDVLLLILLPLVGVLAGYLMALRRHGANARSESVGMEPTFAAAKPGRGHRALASLYRAGKVPGIITQNIDNLHQASGFKADDVIELHGNSTYARRIGCGKDYDLSWVKSQFDKTGGAPDCAECGDPVKTATISFGQSMPEDAMRRAAELARHSDLFLAIGSSLVVWPAAGFPMIRMRMAYQPSNMCRPLARQFLSSC